MKIDLTKILNKKEKTMQIAEIKTAINELVEGLLTCDHSYHLAELLYAFIITRIDMGDAIMPQDAFVYEVIREAWLYNLGVIDISMQKKKHARAKERKELRTNAVGMEKTEVTLKKYLATHQSRVNQFYEQHVPGIRILRKDVIQTWLNGSKGGHVYLGTINDNR